MRDLRLLAETAFQLHEEKHLSREDLISVLEDCVNIAALKNGYAEAHGLPFPACIAAHRRDVERDREIPPRFKSEHLAPYRPAQSSADSSACPIDCAHGVPWTECTACSKTRKP